MSEEKDPKGNDDRPKEESEQPSGSAPPPRRPAPVDYYQGSEEVDDESAIDLSESEKEDRD